MHNIMNCFNIMFYCFQNLYAYTLYILSNKNRTADLELFLFILSHPKHRFNVELEHFFGTEKRGVCVCLFSTFC